MSTITSTQPSRALRIIAPTTTIDIPYVGSVVASGVSGAVLANNLVVTGVSSTFFIDIGIQPGYIIYNLSATSASVVTRVVNGTTLELSFDSFTAIGQGYAIYSEARPALIYNSVAGNNITLVTQDGNTQQFLNVPVGILPVRVRRITAAGSAGGSTFIALW